MKIKSLIVILILTAVCIEGGASVVDGVQMKNYEKSLFGRSLARTREKKIREPRKVVKAQKEQAKNEAKLERDYARYVKESRKRTVEIQTPEVQERMKQNNRTTLARNKEKKKAARAVTKKAGMKYGN